MEEEQTGGVITCVEPKWQMSDKAKNKYTVGMEMISVFSILTWGGSIFVLLPVTLVMIVLFRQSNWQSDGILLLGGVCGASILANILKLVFSRPRPPVEEMLTLVPAGFSFPSAHAAQVFGFAAACFVVFSKNTTISGKFMLYGGLGSAAMLVAFSRVYLSVHYLSDVVVGAVLGIVWVMFLAMILRALEKSECRYWAGKPF